MSDVSTFLLFLRVGFSLAVVLGMIWFAARFAKRRGKLVARQGETASLEVVARRQLGRRGSLLVVESGDRTLLVGVTDSHIGLVADLSDPGRADGPTGRTDATAAIRPATTSGGGTEVVPLAVDDLLAAERLGVDLPAAERRGVPKRESLVDALRDLTVRR
jgi:flagellar biosynthetic protein FliO